MKKLQNNFTTQEQSKRLLELGVPIDSADMFYNNSWGFICVINQGKKIEWEEEHNKHLSPCWSVGRLIEIICKVRTHYIDNNHLVFNFKDNVLDNMVESFVKTLECDYNDGCIDFSKLEE